MIDPLSELAAFIAEATRRGEPEPDAMALATATPDGVPSVRVVLCRGVDTRGLRFFTNYESRKGVELGANPHASAMFFWRGLDVQVRVDGEAERLPAADSDDYFAHRPRGHRLATWASAQSRPIASIEALRDRARQLAEEYEGRDVPRPGYWGGYLLRARALEIWRRGADRLHERLLYERSAGVWSETRLAP